MIKNLKLDKMRYQNNKASYYLAFLSLGINTIYLFKVLSIVTPNFFIGLKILLNIILMLLVFLAMEKTKVYHKNWSLFLLIVGALSFLRILFVPQLIIKMGEDLRDDYILSVVYLILVACLLMVTGIIGCVKAKKLTSYLNEIQTNQAGGK